MAFPSDKDKTDTELSLDYLIEQGYTECVITAFTGTRYDHSCANLFMFAEKTNTINITMIDSHNIATFCTDSIRLDAKPDEYVSIIPLTKTITVEKTEGLAYKLQDYTLKRGMTLGVSNYPDKPEQKITLSHGKALITISHD